MRIVVVVGRVLDPSGFVVNRRAGRVFVNREEYILHPADRCALEAALRIKDASGAEVVALPRAPLPDDDVLRQALSMGADRAIDLYGDALEAADEAVMSRVLAATVGRLGETALVLIGAQTLDTGFSQLGPRLAEALGWPQLVGAWQVDVAEGRVQAVLQSQGRYGVNEADLPAVVSVASGALEPRYPNGVRLINVYRGEGEVAQGLERWDVSSLVEADVLEPLVEQRGLDFPPERERGARARGTPQEMAAAAAEALRRHLRS